MPAFNNLRDAAAHRVTLWTAATSFAVWRPTMIKLFKGTMIKLTNKQDCATGQERASERLNLALARYSTYANIYIRGYFFSSTTYRHWYLWTLSFFNVNRWPQSQFPFPFCKCHLERKEWQYGSIMKVFSNVPFIHTNICKMRVVSSQAQHERERSVQERMLMY